MTNAADLVWRWADETPDADAVRERERSWTFVELRTAVRGAMEELTARGVRRGDRVLMVVPTAAEFIITYYATLALGATAVTVNPLCTQRELTHFVEDAGCSTALGWHETAGAVTATAAAADIPLWVLEPDCVPAPEGAPDPADLATDAPAVLLYTSGTTGAPKGAILTHGNLLSCGASLAEALDLGPGESMGTALPLFHVFGQSSVMSTVYTSGGCMSLQRPFDPAGLLRMAADEQLTAVAGVPTMWNAMLHAETDVTREDLASLRIASSGGAALPLSVGQAFHERFGATVLDGYGLSETAGAASFNREIHPRKEMSVGRALPGGSLAILDEQGRELPPGETGEVAIQGPYVMSGYWNRPEATAAAFSGDWFLTGDIGRMDEDGDLWILDRMKDLVIRGGYNVYPREVEEVLYNHPDVLEAAVIGVPDEQLGEEIAAVVTPQPGSTIVPADLRAWLSEQLAAYKVPRIYQVVEALPKGATGKILKRQIDRGDIAATGERPARTATPTT
ncbi:class I adenylate-forming enzyme family protein [Dietzia massiliensis]|uniref:class I adenylate-forming enzyme family protein n=2 Tax=Dietzia massiliensis TaxID=2697499 RepID=UPI001BD093D8|nr:AMP-binding protein [Dietzia massiliensis]MBS7548907.1 AMP-binding protein [Dietzia massiliensis]